MRMMKRLCGAAIAALTALTLGAGAALAADPVAITDTVTDPEGFLGNTQVDTVRAAARDAAAQGLDIYLVTVATLSGMDPVQWCQESGSGSGLSTSSIVYVIAYEQRQQTSCGNAGEQIVTDGTLTAARAAAGDVLSESNPLTPDATSQATVAFINAVVAGVGSGSGAAVPADPGTGTDSGAGTGTGAGQSSSGISGIAMMVLFVFGAAVVVIVLSALSRKKKGPIDPGLGGSTEGLTLDQKVDLANRRLLEADEMVRSAGDELDFAKAQFGTLRTDEYAAALGAAKAGMGKAFDLQKQMNDPGVGSGQGELADQLLAHLDRLMVPLVNAQRTFTELRDSEAGAEERLGELRERISEVRRSIPTAEAELSSLRIAYSDRVVASLIDNPDQARALLDSAEESANRARGAMGSDKASALEAIDTGQRALAMARLQLSTIMDAQQNLADAAQKLTEAIASITSDLADVTRLGADLVAFEPLVADARAAIEAGRAARAGNADPLEALESLHEAEGALDAALVGLRSADEARNRASLNARNRLGVAEAVVAQADAVVQSRRGVASLETRSAMQTAVSHLTTARGLLDSDPQGSIAASASAETAARRVINAGQQWHPPQQAGSGPDLGNALLWSIFLGQVAGGGNRGGSWGGSGPRTGGFGGGGFGGGGSFGGGGFGGGGTSSF